MTENSPYRIFLSPPYQSGEELEYVKRALESNWLAPGGIYVKQFEEALIKATNRTCCVALNSGTAAIHLALKVLGVGAGDYVLCQSFSFVATANPIAYLGAHPIFIDSEPESWNMDPTLLEAAIVDMHKSGIQPKAIIYAHIYGSPAMVDELISIAHRYEIPLIEDAAEALGARYHSGPIGQFGDISILSFNGNKLITTSGGGALLTNSEPIAQKVLHLATQSRDDSKPYSHTEVGYNYRLSNVSAALGLAQLKFLDDWIRKKRKLFETYREMISSEVIMKDTKNRNGIVENRWLSVFLCSSTKNRDIILKMLFANGIEARRTWMPLHLLNIFSAQKSYLSGVACNLFEKGICLPSGVGLKIEEQKEIIHTINNLY